MKQVQWRDALLRDVATPSAPLSYQYFAPRRWSWP